MVKIFIIEIISLIRPKMTSRDQDLSFDTNNLMIGQKKLLNLRCNVNVWICRDFFNPGELPRLPYWSRETCKMAPPPLMQLCDRSHKYEVRMTSNINNHKYSPKNIKFICRYCYKMPKNFHTHNLNLPTLTLLQTSEQARPVPS